jgi:hypothetical protein
VQFIYIITHTCTHTMFICAILLVDFPTQNRKQTTSTGETTTPKNLLQLSTNHPTNNNIYPNKSPPLTVNSTVVIVPQRTWCITSCLKCWVGQRTPFWPQPSTFFDHFFSIFFTGKSLMPQQKTIVQCIAQWPRQIKI